MSAELPEEHRAALSALMDGDAGVADAACRAWRADASVRADWHAYHLIGDVMRSDEHSSDAARDARLLAAVRARLASEPVVLAPTPAVAAVSTSMSPLARARRARRWMAPTAVAAGFVAVAGALLVTRVSAPDAASGLTASTAATPIAALPVAVASPSAAASQPSAEGTPMIRSAELDRYLAAHRQYANGALQVAPGGGVRNAAAIAPGR